jgi:hypothetical protein
MLQFIDRGLNRTTLGIAKYNDEASKFRPSLQIVNKRTDNTWTIV